MFTGDKKTKLITLGVLCFALFMAMLDSSVVNLALPTIQKARPVGLGASLTGVQWIVDAYILALASLLLTGGTLGDMFGRRKAFIAGLALFTGGSLACSLAPSTPLLIAARAFQGGGAALLLPSTLSILTNTFRDPRERAQAIGIWAGVSGLSLAIGPLVGGTMVDQWGWQSIFLINVPIGIVAAIVALRNVPESSDRTGRSLDLPGQALAIVGLATLTYAFVEANSYGWTSTRILTCFIVAGVALGGFFLVELFGRSPMLQLKFFRNTTFSGANAVGLLVSFAFFGVLFFLGLYFQNVMGYSPTMAGVYSLPSTLGVAGAGFLSGRITARIGSRVPMTAGLVMMGSALLLLTSVGPSTPYGSFWYWLVLMGTGCGLVMSPMTTAIMSSVPPQRAGMASSTSNTMRQVGSVFGIAVLGNILTRRFVGQLGSSLRALHLPGAVSRQVMAIAGQGRQAAPTSAPAGVDMAAIGHAVNQSFTSGFSLVLWIAGAILLAAAPLALVTIRGTAPHHQRARAARDARRAAQAAPTSALAGEAAAMIDED
jgi:EmrB/QacA subfamily drug resistance transporter